MQVTLTNGWVPELGGPDAVTPLMEAVAELEAEERAAAERSGAIAKQSGNGA
jgi:hypothetical protein